MEATWQGRLVKAAAGLTCFGVGLVAFLTASATYNPRGPEGEEGAVVYSAAIVIVLIVAMAMLILIAGFFTEKEALGDRLPSCKWKGALAMVPLLAFLLPLVHLLFALAMCGVLLAVVLACLTDPLRKLRGVAVFDALLCVGISLLMLRAGPTADYGPARMLVAQYAGIGGALLPGMAIIVSCAYTPNLARATCAVYALAAMHAGAILLQALTNQMFWVFDGVNSVYSNEQCFPQLPSPGGLVLAGMGSIAKGTPWANGTTPAKPKPCSVPEVHGHVGPGCDSLPWELVLTALGAGLWISLVLALQLLWTQPARVHPVSAEDAALQARKSKRRDMAKNGARVFLLLAGVTVAILGWLFLWVCPEPDLAGGLAGNLTNITTVTSTSTMTTSTATSTTTTTTTTTSTGEGLNASNASNMSNVSELMNGTNVSTGIFISEGENCSDEVPPPSISTPPPPREGCRCGDSPARGLWAWVAVPAEQLAGSWCDFGNWTPVSVGLFLFCCHSFAGSLVLGQLVIYSEKERELAYKKKLAKIRTDAARRGTSMAEASKEGEGGGLVLWRQAPRDPLPKPAAKLGDQRLFNV